MTTSIARRRYLTNFESHRLPHLFTDVLVIGSGVAGLRAALAAAEHCDVLIAVKDEALLSCTSWAQGGVAAAVDPADSADSHATDTMATACELGDRAVIDLVTRDAPRCIEELIAWGASFDRSGERLAIGLEGGHSAARIIHAHGDATGREIARVLLEKVREHPRIRVFEKCFAIDLLTLGGSVAGAITFHPRYGHQFFWSSATILASGGAGRVYRESTNPPIATGDGLAMALRAGATLRDMEMIQFHPTTLYVAGAARALISEAVRGEGALLLNKLGERFMPGYDTAAELAPRDVVSRAIHAEMRRTQSACAFLDVRHFKPARFAQRFPSLDRLCRDFDIEPEKDLIPVRPSAHYTVGGVVADAECRSDVAGLFACGEVAHSGLHGANRLASNSLLEGLVFGQRAGIAAGESAAATPRKDRPPQLNHLLPKSTRTELDLEDVLHSLQSMMSRNVAIERSGDRLRETTEIIDFWSRYVMDKVFDEPAAWETQNLLTVAAAITLSAATRCESRGVHFRSDFPQTDAAWRLHIDLRRVDDSLQVSTSPVGQSSAPRSSTFAAPK
ncbi:MAG: L-aspartate oxidase [Phycisphaerae bacterium]